MRSEDSPRLMTLGRDAMMRLGEDAGEVDRLCSDVKVLTGGSGPPLDTWDQSKRSWDTDEASCWPKQRWLPDHVRNLEGNGLKVISEWSKKDLEVGV